MPQLSVIIPTLNEEEYLPKLLDSLKKQSFKDFEIIVSDAGSKDKTAELAKKAGAKVVDGGMPGVGRNRGAAVAQGEYLFFFDADVTLPPDFLENAMKEFNEKFIHLATCEFKPDSDLRLDILLFNFANLTVKLNQNTNPRAAGFCIFVSKRLFNRIKGFDKSLKLAEDHDFVARAHEFAPLHFLDSTHLYVSVRRLAKEGRFSLIEKYFQVEWHLLTKGSIREDIVEYEFGNFENKNSESKRTLDIFEERIIQLEKQYNDFANKYLQNNRFTEAIQENQKRLRSMLDAFTGLLTGKPKNTENQV